jgi:hypothetical protein
MECPSRNSSQSSLLLNLDEPLYLLTYVRLMSPALAG